MYEDIGTTAGQIWHHLHLYGAIHALKLKSALGISNTRMYLALGWLARENKIEITEIGHTCEISLKTTE